MSTCAHTLCSKRAHYKKHSQSENRPEWHMMTAASSAFRNVHKWSSRAACTKRRRKMENVRTLQTVGPGTWPVISWWSVECTSPKPAESHPANWDAEKKKKQDKTTRTQGCNKHRLYDIRPRILDVQRTISRSTQNWHCGMECGSGKAVMLMTFLSWTNAAHNATPQTELAFLQKFSFHCWLKPAMQGVHC